MRETTQVRMVLASSEPESQRPAGSWAKAQLGSAGILCVPNMVHCGSMELSVETVPDVVRESRERSGLAKSRFAEAVGTSRSALDELEKGSRMPRVDTLLRVIKAGGLDLHTSLSPDPTQHVGTSGGVQSLAQFVNGLDRSDPAWMWRSLVSDFVANEFLGATRSERAWMLAERPLVVGDRWDSFVGALAEHLGFHGEVGVPAWADADEFSVLDSFWWPVHGELPSMRTAALAFSPASFKRRRILVDGRELPEIFR